MSDSMDDQWEDYSAIQLGQFVQAQLDELDTKPEKQVIHVLSAMWYGLTSKGQSVTLGTFTTELKAQEFLDKFRAADTGHAQYGDYNIFEERLDPTFN